MTESRLPGIALLPGGDRFEDFHDRIGVSWEDLRDGLTGTWLFNYVETLQAAGLRPVLYFMSARVPDIVRFTHEPTGAAIRFLPAPWLHRKLQGTRDRLGIRSPMFASLLSYAATPWRALATEFRRDGCGAILCQEYQYPRFDEAVMLQAVLGMPIFASFQGGSRTRSVVERVLRRTTIRRASGLIIGSRAEVHRVRTAYGVPAERIALIPNAMDLTKWRPRDRHDARAALGIDDETRVVVWHGRVEIDSKGLDVLFDAWTQLCATRPNVRLLLLLVGTGRDRGAVQRRAASLPVGTLRWEDRWVRDRSQIQQYLSAADIAVLSSRREGFPVAVVEAMACGLPVVATDVSGVRDAFGEESVGVVVPSEDASALAHALGRLLDDEPLRRSLGERARRRAESEFSLQTVGVRLRAFMEQRGAFQQRSAAPELGSYADPERRKRDVPRPT